jgi:arginyl-tRNA synthetase
LFSRPVLVIGYELLKKYDYPIDKDVKMDHFLGKVYSINHTMYDIQKLKQKLDEKTKLDVGKNPYWLTEKEVKKIHKELPEIELPEDEKKALLKELDFIFTIQEDIHKRTTKLYSFLKDCLETEQIDLVTAIPDLNRRYINKEGKAVKAVRTTCQDVLDGQKEQLALMGIHHDHFDWEADLEWSGKVEKVLEKIDENGYLIKEGKAKLVDVNKAANLKGAREYLNLKKDYEVPKAILVTSKGDSLYLLRDIAYTIKKADHYNADHVFNVIGKGQELTQTQLNLAVRAAGREDVANKLHHLNYEFMELKGALTSMSARRMQYITPLELFNRTKAAVKENFLKERDYPEKEKEKIAEIVAVGAIKYSIIAIGLMKKLIFDPEKVVSLHDNTSPFIQYAYARSQNILAKTDFSWKEDQSNNLEKLVELEEWVLVLTLGELPRIIREAAEQIKPEIICSYLFELANLFNKFYDSHRVLDAQTKELINARLALTTAVGKIIATGLDLLSIESPKRM